MRLRWERRAITDIEEIYTYIAAANPKAAKCVVDRIEKFVSRLLFMPMSGRPGVKKGRGFWSFRGCPMSLSIAFRARLWKFIAVLHTSRRRRS